MSISAQQKYKDAKDRISSIRKTMIILAVVLTLFSGELTKQFFSYEVQEEVTSRESYQYPTGTITTYICYTTEYGSCYHAKGCGSLWNSSHKTTVYEARKAGYVPCSKCTPTAKTTITLTETRYMDVKKTETVTKEPTFLVWLCGTGCLALTYFFLTAAPRKQQDDALAEIEASK